MDQMHQLLDDMNDRTREVFRRVVENYLESGEPVGSRTLTREFSENVSAATIRNVMQDLELMGLLDSPHISAGRMPTELGLRLFVDGVLEAETLGKEDQAAIEATRADGDPDLDATMARIGRAVSGLTRSASLVLAPKKESAIKHVEFVSLSADRALVVLVYTDGQVENRVFTPPPGQTPSSMREAANFLNAFVEGKTLSELQRRVVFDIQTRQQEIDEISRSLVESGIAAWEDTDNAENRLIVRGRSNLIDGAGEDLERIKVLFDDLERKRDIVSFLELTEQGEGVRIFIGAENKLFSLSGSSLVVSPYMNADRKVVGAVGVIGPKRLNYGRIVPIVNYTADLIGRMLSDQ